MAPSKPQALAAFLRRFLDLSLNSGAQSTRPTIQLSFSEMWPKPFHAVTYFRVYEEKLKSAYFRTYSQILKLSPWVRTPRPPDRHIHKLPPSLIGVVFGNDSFAHGTRMLTRNSPIKHGQLYRDLRALIWWRTYTPVKSWSLLGFGIWVSIKLRRLNLQLKKWLGVRLGST